MHDYKLLKKNTPVVFAKKQNAAIATIHPSLPDIYYKSFDITEFIGEQLASVRGVRSNHYFPVCFDLTLRDCIENPIYYRNNMKVGSFDFKKPGVTYETALSLPYYYDKDSFLILLDRCCSDQNREEFINENLEMFALDIYMSQWDRGGNTFYEFHPNGEIHLAPVFDYESSMNKLDAKDLDYTSDFFQFLSLDDYHEMMIKYPQFKEMLQTYLSVDLEGQLISMARNRNFDISGIDMDSYRRYDEVVHKKLEKILK